MLRKMAILIACLALLTTALAPAAVEAATAPPDPNGWTELASGVFFQEYSLPGPVRVFVAAMSISGEDPVALESAIAQGRLGSVETVRGMAARYDDAINFWGSEWGNRSDILVAVNGSYFGNGDTPENGMVQSGWYAKRFDDNTGGSGLVWTLNRQVFIGDCIVHKPEKQTLQIGDTAPVQVSGINIAPEGDEIILYTPQFGARTPARSGGVEIVVQLTRPLLIIPPSGSAVVGTITAVRESSDGSTLIPFDSLVISVGKDLRGSLPANLELNTTVRFNQEITGFKRDCKTTTSLPWTKAYASIGAALHLLEGGTAYPPEVDDTRAPRTAIAYDAGFIYLIVVDGRQPDYSIGMTFQELAQFITGMLGAQNAVAQDGGGSSTMVANGRVVNRPSNICYRVFLPLISSPGGQVITTPSLSLEENFEPASRLSYGCERRVANSIMIARVAPKETSTTWFGSAGAVFTTVDAVLRVGPGTNYAGFTVIPAGAYGLIDMDETTFNGVRAKGTYWWKVTFNGQTGWIAEGAIAALAPRYAAPSNRR